MYFENKLFFLWFLLCLSEIYPAEISYVFVPKPEISQNFLEGILSQAWDNSKRQASHIPKNL